MLFEKRIAQAALSEWVNTCERRQLDDSQVGIFEAARWQPIAIYHPAAAESGGQEHLELGSDSRMLGFVPILTFVTAQYWTATRESKRPDS